MRSEYEVLKDWEFDLRKELEEINFSINNCKSFASIPNSLWEQRDELIYKISLISNRKSMCNIPKGVEK